MHFCDKCGNMFYISLMDGDKEGLVYHCKKCGNVDKNISDSGIVVSKTNIKKKTQQYQHMINKYTKLDPTLPREDSIDCPNEECPSKAEEVEKEVINIRYDNDNMKYIYLCAVCDKVWTLENN